MDKQLYFALLRLVDFIERENLEDEYADDGDGYTDTWRSDEFQGLIDAAKATLRAYEAQPEVVAEQSVPRFLLLRRGADGLFFWKGSDEWGRSYEAKVVSFREGREAMARFREGGDVPYTYNLERASLWQREEG